MSTVARKTRQMINALDWPATTPSPRTTILKIIVRRGYALEGGIKYNLYPPTVVSPPPPLLSHLVILSGSPPPLVVIGAGGWEKEKSTILRGKSYSLIERRWIYISVRS